MDGWRQEGGKEGGRTGREREGAFRSKGVMSPDLPLEEVLLCATWCEGTGNTNYTHHVTHHGRGGAEGAQKQKLDHGIVDTQRLYYMTNMIAECTQSLNTRR